MLAKFRSKSFSSPSLISDVTCAHRLQKFPQITFSIDIALLICSLIYFYFFTYSYLYFSSYLFLIIHLFFIFYSFSLVSWMIFYLSLSTLSYSSILAFFYLFYYSSFLRCQLLLKSDESSLRWYQVSLSFLRAISFWKSLYFFLLNQFLTSLYLISLLLNYISSLHWLILLLISDSFSQQICCKYAFLASEASYSYLYMLYQFFKFYMFLAQSFNFLVYSCLSFIILIYYCSAWGLLSLQFMKSQTQSYLKRISPNYYSFTYNEDYLHNYSRTAYLHKLFCQAQGKRSICHEQRHGRYLKQFQEYCKCDKQRRIGINIILLHDRNISIYSSPIEFF